MVGCAPAVACSAASSCRHHPAYVQTALRHSGPCAPYLAAARHAHRPLLAMPRRNVFLQTTALELIAWNETMADFLRSLPIGKVVFDFVALRSHVPVSLSLLPRTVFLRIETVARRLQHPQAQAKQPHLHARARLRFFAQRFFVPSRSLFLSTACLFAR